MSSSWTTVIRDAAIVVAVSAGVALGANALRPGGSIALIAARPYDILIPCPELQGQPARPLTADRVTPGEPGTLLVDARERDAFDAWHVPGAISIPYDYLEPKPEERKVLRTGARKVVVYGDGERPDSGQQLANAISSKGVKNVYYVEGGVKALRGGGR